MTEIDDRLTDLLHRSADGVAVRPDLDAVRADADRAVVRLDERPARARRRLALAGVAAAVVVVAAVIALRPPADRPTETAGAPTGEALYPVVDLPAEVADRTHAALAVDVVSDDAALVAPTSRAVLGERSPDGTLSRLVDVRVGAAGPQPIEDVADIGVEIAGRPGSMTADGRTVYVDGDPRVAFDGAEEVMSRVRAFTQVVAAWDDEGRPTLDLSLPPPTTSLVALAAVPDDDVATLTATDGAGRSVVVRTVTDAPIVELADAGSVSPVDVDGSPGYQVPDGSRVAWTSPSGVNATVEVVGLPAGTALDVARSLRLVDVDTWMATYPGGPQVAGSVPAATPAAGLVGRPAPPLPGKSTAGEEVTYADRWTVVAMGPADCAVSGCTDGELDALVGVVAPPRRADIPPEALLQLVAVVEAPSVGALAADAEAVGFDGAAVPGSAADLMEAWELDALPAFAVVDPDGIVASIQTGPVTTEAIVAALIEATTSLAPPTTGDATATTLVDPPGVSTSEPGPGDGTGDGAEVDPTPDEAAIDAAFHTAFDAGISDEERFAAVEDGPALVEAGREAVARFPEAAASISVTVHSVDVVAPDRATVVFELTYDGAMLLGRRTGEAVRIDGVWKVGRATRCALIAQAGAQCP